jgi:hypothetical protein
MNYHPLSLLSELTRLCFLFLDQSDFSFVHREADAFFLPSFSGCGVENEPFSFSLYTMRADAFFLFYSCRKTPQGHYPIKEWRPRQLKFLGKPVIDANQELENENFKSIAALKQTATNRHPLSDECYCATDAVCGQGLIVRSKNNGGLHGREGENKINITQSLSAHGSIVTSKRR